MKITKHYDIEGHDKDLIIESLEAQANAHGPNKSNAWDALGLIQELLKESDELSKKLKTQEEEFVQEYECLDKDYNDICKELKALEQENKNLSSELQDIYLGYY